MLDDIEFLNEDGLRYLIGRNVKQIERLEQENALLRKHLLKVVEKPKKKEEIKPMVRNAFHCKKCGKTVESKSQHDFQQCSCGNYVDGGLVCPRAGGNADDMEMLYYE